MCGIVGFTGTQQAAPILLSGLSKLEYRGYDSAGIAVRDGERLAQVVKAKGRLGNLIEKTDEGKALIGTCGIGHTRWATHGEPSQINAHPHVSGNCTRSGSGEVESEVVGVHNGIIENYTELKEKLLKHGYTFYSQTDTEVVIKLVDYYYKKYNLGPIDAIAKTMVRVRGSYALELMFKDYPGEIWVARKDSPMIIGVTDGETYVASDVPAILKYTRNVYYIGNLEFARLTPGEAHFFNLDGDEIEKQTTEIKWDAEAAEKAGFEHFMMKEIHEQPKAVQDTLSSVIKNNDIDLSSVEITEEEIQKFEQMSDDEILAAHGILSYSQTLEWKGAVEYCMTDRNGTAIEKKIDTSLNYYGTVLNAQTLEHAVPSLRNSVEKIIVIENKANYESMEYDPKVLYIFCHGYFSPKEVRFLQMLMKTAPEEIQCYHWGDMDYGGIQIFLYNEKNIFPNLIPWKMDVPSYKAALEKEKGIKLCSKKQKKLEALNAGKLEVLKQCILENKMEIEQEMLI